MMFKKALTKSGRRILKAIKKISTSRLEKKLQQQQHQLEQHQLQLQHQQLIEQQQQTNWCLQMRLYEQENCSVVSCSLPSLDAKSIDTFVTYVPDSFLPEDCYVSHCCCCCCDEREENERNENLENEMMH